MIGDQRKREEEEEEEKKKRRRNRTFTAVARRSPVGRPRAVARAPSPPTGCSCAIAAHGSPARCRHPWTIFLPHEETERLPTRGEIEATLPSFS
ncbi:hypothetical protein B296_00042879 [Ensete ventricosum]|uniref:Uncharacterized protein n=1 Tax=Ensete ventricosum TaxID=4639 RepID=A0A426ZGT0_ENSVE|nr:hypothetical protein B296_00042879 [Ensete ventricosum]